MEDFKKEITNVSSGQGKGKDKSWAHYFFGIPSEDAFGKNTEAIFYRDPSEGFKKTSLVGMDMRLLIGNALFFYLMHIIFLNVEISLFFTFLWDGFLRYLRNSFGEDNISKKTMIDERFLI